MGKSCWILKKAIYDFVDQHPKMELIRYEAILKKPGINWSFRALKDANVTTIDGQTVLTVIMSKKGEFNNDN